MSRFDFAPVAGLSADLEAPFERAVARWVLAHGGDITLAELAARTARAEAAGDSCVALTGEQASRHGLTALTHERIAQLQQHPLVSQQQTIAPFIIDAEQRFYFWRNWRHEQCITDRLLARLHQPRRGLHGEPLEAALTQAFADSDAALDQQQRQAVKQALLRGLLILTGGPGTGKSRTVGRLIEVARRLHDSPFEIKIAAPTGKAAQRLNLMFEQGASGDLRAQTVHRLLGFDPDTQRFCYGRAQALQCDLLVVDEVSMLDLGTLRALLDAVPTEATLVLMGDAEQLQSVTTGSVLDDIVQALESLPESPVVRLQQGFRSDASLQAAFQAAREGDADSLLATGGDLFAPIQWHDCEHRAELESHLQRWTRQLIDSLAELPYQSGEAAAAQLLTAWQQQQLLCALNEGPFGAAEVSQRIESMLREAWRVAPSESAFAGRAIMIRQNDYARGLFNGDLGVLLPDAAGRMRAWFPATGQEGLLSFAPSDLPHHSAACALTVHKSQGSEYPSVALLLPPNADSRILSRQLVYTALTRARKRIEVWGSDRVIRAALARRSSRLGGLRERLAEAATHSAA